LHAILFQGFFDRAENDSKGSQQNTT
jgi:hypothetical protein